MSAGAKILLIDDDAGITDTLKRVLVGEGHEVVVERRGDDGLARAGVDTFNLVITDLRLPGLSGLELVQKLHSAQPRLPIILTTAFGTTEVAIEATKNGAYDYLLKPFDIPELLDLVQKAADSNRLMSEPVSLGEPGSPHDALVGQSAVMRAIYKEIGRAAPKAINVLIRGETGTGKELIARAIYQHSDRAAAPFIAVNCAAIPETLLESELFGHEKGAFTGAQARRIGRFEQAHLGTIFLDEIGDMTPGTQVKLLRVLEQKCLQRLGGKEDIPLDVRVIAATHSDLESAIRKKEFREDLYYRLNVVAIHLPPLRQRREDIPDLVRYFLRKHGPVLGNAEPSIHPDAIEFLRAQPWPGNVRELENAVRKALLLAQNYTLNQEHFQKALTRNNDSPESGTRPLAEYVDDLLAAARRGELADVHSRVIETAERELFARAIREAQGNQTKAARWLGVTRVTMKAKLVQFGLHSATDGEGE
ncbi:MAG TPA: sigma-54 dependent transcriptional regulator [Verrucomicrobiae bacterium]|jgi:DNA-binding NtrC family response regulator|nr:sigma-54 dependent transcriptional regulator [Verrucomicrobiae bacterium]